MASSSSSSSSSVVPTRKGGCTYDVFLSFSARDTGYTFSDILYAALVQEPIQVFKHGYAGQTISEDVVKAIKESRFAVVVFSKNYANSSLCLEELSMIMKCLNQTGGLKKVLPVFYHVDPSDICVQEQWRIHKYIAGVCKCLPWCERAYATEQEGEEDALTAATKLPDLVLIPPNNTGEGNGEYPSVQSISSNSLCVFVKRFLKAAKSYKELELLSFYLIDMCLVEYEMLKFPPSLLAAAAIFTAECTLSRSRQWTKTSELHSNYTERNLWECSKMMVGLHQKSGSGKLLSVYKKYGTSKYGYVSQTEPANFMLEPKFWD